MNSLNNDLNGWLVINKDLGMTSRQVVNIIKKTLNVKKNWSCWNFRSFSNRSSSSCSGKSNKNGRIHNEWYEKV